MLQRMPFIEYPEAAISGSECLRIMSGNAADTLFSIGRPYHIRRPRFVIFMTASKPHMHMYILAAAAHPWPRISPGGLPPPWASGDIFDILMPARCVQHRFSSMPSCGISDSPV